MRQPTGGADLPAQSVDTPRTCACASLRLLRGTPTKTPARPRGGQTKPTPTNASRTTLWKKKVCDGLRAIVVESVVALTLEPSVRAYVRRSNAGEAAEEARRIDGEEMRLRRDATSSFLL